MNRDLNQYRVRVNSEPAWKGPVEDGVSQSLLHSYLVCKERFRITAIDGISVPDAFNKSIEFGQMWHICEEHLAAGTDWEKPLKEYAADISIRVYRTETFQINQLYNLVKILFPIYIDYWSDDPEVKNREPLFQEKVFKIEYELPSGRKVKLRGKFDAVDVIKGEGVYLQENKTKSQIDNQAIELQLNNDLQVMMYLIALRAYVPKEKIKGVRYNVIRRPLGGGKGTIRLKKGTKNIPAETYAEFYERLEGVIKEDVDSYFSRWKAEVSEEDLDRFAEETLNPILEDLVDDYEWWEYCKVNNHNIYDYLTRQKIFRHHLQRHYRLPYGTYNVVQRGGQTELDHYMNTGSTVGLCNIKEFFRELI